MTVKLTSETLIVIDREDMAAILTAHFCGSSYDTFGGLYVNAVNARVSGDFELSLWPNAPEQETNQ